MFPKPGDSEFERAIEDSLIVSFKEMSLKRSKAEILNPMLSVCDFILQQQGEEGGQEKLLIYKQGILNIKILIEGLIKNQSKIPKFIVDLIKVIFSDHVMSSELGKILEPLARIENGVIKEHFSIQDIATYWFNVAYIKCLLIMIKRKARRVNDDIFSSSLGHMGLLSGDDQILEIDFKELNSLFNTPGICQAMIGKAGRLQKSISTWVDEQQVMLAEPGSELSVGRCRP